MTVPSNLITTKYYASGGTNNTATVSISYNENTNSMYLSFKKYRYDRDEMENDAPVDISYLLFT